LQQLNGDGTVNQAGTQQMLAALQQQLGSNFTQTTVSDKLDTSFTAMGGFGASSLVMMAFAVVVSIMTFGAASAVVGSTLGSTAGSTFASATAATTTTEGVAMPAVTAGLGNVALSAGIAGFTSSAVTQLANTGSLNWGSAFETGAVAAITAGLTNGITYNSTSGLDFSTVPLTVGGPTSSLASLAGVNPSIGSTVNQASASTATTLETRALAMLGEAGISAGVGTAIEGGSFGTAFKDALTQEAAAAGAFAIGNAQLTLTSGLGPVGGEVAYLALHGALGCAAGAASGPGCGGGASGGAVSAATANEIASLVTGGQGVSNPEQLAAITAATMLLSGGVAGLLGQNAVGAATAAENETLNNTCGPGHKCGLNDDNNAAKPGHESEAENDSVPIVQHAPIDEEQAGATFTVPGGGSPIAGSATNGGAPALSPSQQATAWQGSGAYPGIDSYTDVVLPKGTYVVGAAPGQSSFYTTLNGFNSTDGTAEGYYQALQIQPNLTNSA
jgi:filamentous hemagglutinin